MLKEILINPIDNCVKEKHDKNYIILLDTLRNDFDKYITSLSKKEYAPSYLIKKDGTIHKFYDDSYYTNFSNIEKINKKSIFIAIENSGKLTKEENFFVNWCNEKIEINNIEKIFIDNNLMYYEKYTNEQIKSLGHLIIYLGNKHNLNLKHINPKNKENSSILFLKDVDIFSYSLNPIFNIEKLNSIIFEN
jgi:N-acetyl-anhydromuramyl-L-alanine amidase AmpD